jgi:hypothetical protein
MSKSKGNVILPEEVVFGVIESPPGYEFRAVNGLVLDPSEWGIWRNKNNDGCYYTNTQSGRRPVFLCKHGDNRTCVLIHNGKEIEQHPELLANLPELEETETDYIFTIKYGKSQ